MGCVCLTSTKDQLKVFSNFEDSLKFHTTDTIKVFETILQEAGRGQTQIKKERIQSIWSSHGLKLSKNLEFYLNFQSEKSESTYNSRLLSDLIILVSDIQIETKAMLFWMNYTSIQSTFLDTKAVKEMIGDVLLICLEVVPRYVNRLKGKERFVHNCTQKFSLAKPFVMEWFLEKIIGKKREIYENDFLMAFQNKHIGVLVNSHKLRKFALEYEEKLESQDLEHQQIKLQDDENVVILEEL